MHQLRWLYVIVSLLLITPIPSVSLPTDNLLG
ncbi:hypothetical protein PEC301937_39840 [Pectobacterium carotovorum subsp. carotovorum]|nr:hypothetical protein PEC301937_39840 [Pectobacterium carotovorum subsp. carotovorum]